MTRVSLFPVHPGLADSSRLPVHGRAMERVDAAQMLVLLGAGVAAALATAFLDFSLKLPGHAILRVVFPMSLGLALAPRRLGGAVMGAGALATAMLIQSGGLATIGVGAMTSLVLTGPLLDLALMRARRGWRLYAGFAVAGLVSNLAALGARGAAKLVGLETGGQRPFGLWWPQAVGSYALCGLLAGVICAIIWFRFVTGQGRPQRESAP